MKNIVFILLFLMISLFNTTISFAQIKHYSKETINFSTMTMLENENCHGKMLEMTKEDSKHKTNCVECDKCQKHCHNLSNNIVFFKAVSFQNEDRKYIYHSIPKNFIKSEYKKNLFRPPIV